jgi:hypothetical protein
VKEARGGTLNLAPTLKTHESKKRRDVEREGQWPPI